MRSKLALLGLLLWATPVFAQDLDSQIEQSQARQKALAEKNRVVATELSALQKKLVAAGQAVNDNETELADSEDKLRILGDQLKPRQDKLAANQKHLESMLGLALKFSQMPPEAMVMMPGDTESTMKAARAMKMATASIKEELEETRLQIEELKKLQDKIATRRDAIVAARESLVKEKASLETALAARKGLMAQLKTQEQEEAEKAEGLAKKEEDLQGVITSLNKSAHGRFAPGSHDEGQRGSLRSFADAKGRIRQPAGGKMVQAFGAAAVGDDTSKGILIQTRRGASVVAPYDAEVVFAGTFLSYGRMVILRHSDEFHTLLAGLSRIDVKTGEFLLEGEPIGDMGDESENRLYVELRKDNVPVDPVPWMKKLEK